MFYSIPNLAATVTTAVPEPWNLSPQAIPDFGTDKKAFKKWCQQLGTKHYFLSGFEGMTAGVRVSQDLGNNPFKIHAFIADYDNPVAADAFVRLTDQPKSEFLPTYGVYTWSGNGRLVWELEEPVMLASKTQIKEFLTIVQRKLCLGDWLSGLDAKAFMDYSKYYEYGRTWVPMTPTYRIPKAFIHLWLYEASKNTRLSDDPTQYNIPMEDIAAKVEDVFPGRWSGPFELGARGVRFWDATASDPTGAVVMEQGMMAFSGEQAFVPWRQIFGSQFVEEYEANKVASILDKTVYDGKQYWMEKDDKTWVEMTETLMNRKLKVMQFNPKPRKGSTCSEIDVALDAITTNRRVFRAMPFVLHPPGVIQHKGRLMLNTCTAQCMIPNRNLDTVDAAVAMCPWIWSFLKALLVDEHLQDPMIQLNVFLHWLKVYYMSGLAQNPVQGQALFLLGPTNVGKTLLTKRILSPLLGGSSDASGFLTGSTTWSSKILQSPMAVVDDAIPTGTKASKDSFSALIKKIVANAELQFSEKYMQDGDVPYFGRILVLANLDSHSRQIIPELDIGNRDKVMLMKIMKHNLKFDTRDNVEREIAAELPNFARFLELWTPPASAVAEDNRFSGVPPYKHPEIQMEASDTGTASMLFEMLVDFLDLYREGHAGEEFWEGTITTLHKDMTVANASVAREYDRPLKLGIALNTLIDRKRYRIEKERDAKRKVNVFRIYFDIMGDDDGHEDDSKPQTHAELVAETAVDVAEGIKADEARGEKI